MQLDLLKNIIIQESREIEEDLIKMRRHLHKYPELSLEEYETSKYIEDRLNVLGIPNRKVTETGIVALIAGEKSSSNSSNKTIGLRADIDALPITEKTDLPFASVNEGVMHACGHDGHTTILLGAAEILFKHRKNISGNILCIFQPAEEEGNGASKMISNGVFSKQNADAILALHLWPYLPLGSIGVRSGSMTASCDDFNIEIIGKSGHGSRPQEGIDAIMIATEIMQSIQYIVTKLTRPLDSVVVHIGEINGGKARNVIADHVILKGTARALTTANRERLKSKIVTMSKKIGEMYGAEIRVDYMFGPSPVINDERITEIISDSAKELWGKKNIFELKEPSLGADDFGEFSQLAPSSYFRLGIQKGDINYDLHHPKFTFDEKILSIGAATFAYFAVNTIHILEEYSC